MYRFHFQLPFKTNKQTHWLHFFFFFFQLWSVQILHSIFFHCYLKTGITDAALGTVLWIQCVDLLLILSPFLCWVCLPQCPETSPPPPDSFQEACPGWMYAGQKLLVDSTISGVIKGRWTKAMLKRKKYCQTLWTILLLDVRRKTFTVSFSWVFPGPQESHLQPQGNCPLPALGSR